ncbi:MAG: hypothetical protein JOZ05_01875 [Acetobacteraceae bacterium]|nr:hypothetical protein [Acetobacteraceae bacterium]
MGSIDSVLQTRVTEAKRRTLAWLDTMQAPGEPRGVCRISPAHNPAAWPGMLLPGTYNAAMCRSLLGGLDGFSEAERDALSAWLKRHRLEDGRFRVPGMKAEDVFKKPDPLETWRYIDWHVTNYALGAIEATTPGARPILDFALPYLDRLTLKAWLADRDLRDPWQEGNNIVNLGGFLLAMRRHGVAPSAVVDGAMAVLFDWHDRLQEPSTGFWGVNQTTKQGALHAMAGSMHSFHLYHATRRTLPYQDKAIDYALAQPTRVVSACIDVDLVDLLVHGHLLTGHRRADIRAWCRALLSALLDIENEGGGFWDEREGTRRQDGWVRGYAEKQGISNTFATWFRWIAIAMIADLLWPGWNAWCFRREPGIGYRL